MEASVTVLLLAISVNSMPYQTQLLREPQITIEQSFTTVGRTKLGGFDVPVAEKQCEDAKASKVKDLEYAAELLERYHVALVPDWRGYECFQIPAQK